jgi:hypothetical protein
VHPLDHVQDLSRLDIKLGHLSILVSGQNRVGQGRKQGDGSFRAGQDDLFQGFFGFWAGRQWVVIEALYLAEAKRWEVENNARFVGSSRLMPNTLLGVSEAGPFSQWD